MKIDMKNYGKLRQGVIEALPEAKNIKDDNLRERVYDAWAMSLSTSSYKRIEDIAASGGPSTPGLRKGTQADHLNGVARIGVGIATGLRETFVDFNINMDEVIAGGLCHDLGKPFEFDPENRKRWQGDPGTAGLPSMRHTLHGIYVAIAAGLPEEIVHIVGAHSLEGENVVRSTVCDIIHFADYAFWRVLGKAGQLDKFTGGVGNINVAIKRESYEPL